MEYIYSFVVGGSICIIGQILMDATNLTAPRVLVILVVTGAILQLFNLYQPLVDIGSTGARVPLTGFGYSLVKGAIDSSKGTFLQAICGGINSVIGGLVVAICWGYIIALIFNPKSIR